MVTALLIANLAVNTWLLIILYRRNVRKQLPWFALYVAWEFFLACIQIAAWTISSRFYIAVYWWTEAIAVVLIVAAVRESFLRIFEGFTRFAWFRWSVWGVIIAVVIYSAWKALYAPPVQGNRLTPFVVGAEFAFRWGVAAIGMLSALLMFLLEQPMGTREDSVVTGFGIASIAFVAHVVLVSLFGTRFIFFSTYLPSVGYFVAVFLWIWAFSRPVREFGLKELGVGPEDVAKTLRGYREAAKRIRGKKL
jgi:hypothetical protein